MDINLNKNDPLDPETLCKECGLCCEGVFHTFAYLYNDEDISIAKKANIPIEFNTDAKSNVFTLGCPAFNGLCSIYPERPSVCSKHKCNLLKSVINHDIILNNALKKVSEIKNILNVILPILKKYTGNHTSNKPEYLLSKILDNLENQSTRDNFKKENKTLFMKYGIFYFIKEKYFYKSSTTQNGVI